MPYGKWQKYLPTLRPKKLQNNWYGTYLWLKGLKTYCPAQIQNFPYFVFKLYHQMPSNNFKLIKTKRFYRKKKKKTEAVVRMEEDYSSSNLIS